MKSSTIIKLCEWTKRGYKYYTGCGHVTNRGGDWAYCPYCGRPLLDMDRKAADEPEVNQKRAKEGLVKGRYYKRR